MSELTTGPNQKPQPHEFYGDSWERGKDPFHIDAFKGTPVENDVNGFVRSGARVEGWFLIDGAGNAVGFVPDGSPVASEAQK